jgi:hypothetical protein
MELNVVSQLGLDFDEVYKRTNTSYKPIKLLVYDDLGGKNGLVIINQHHLLNV